MKGTHDMTDDVKQSFWKRCYSGVSPNDKRNQKWILSSNLAWALSYIGAIKILKRELVAGPVAWVIAAVPAILGIVVVVVYGRFLRQTDELQRLIQLEALALGFGGSFFAFCGYAVFQRLGAPSMDITTATIVMVFLYLFGVFLGTRRYR